MKSRLLTKIQSNEQYAGISLVVLIVLSLLMPLATVLMLTLLAFLAWNKPARFAWVAIAYAALPALVAFAAHHAAFGQHCLSLWVMGLATNGLVLWSKKSRALPTSRLVMVVTVVAFVLAAAVTWFFPQVEAYWRESYLQLIQQLDLKVPADMLTEIKQSNMFVLETGWSLMLTAQMILLSIALGLYLTAATTKSGVLLQVLERFQVKKSCLLALLVYAAVLYFYHPAWLLAGLPVVIVPFALSGLSLCMAKQWLRSIWWFAVWVSILILLFSLIQSPMLIVLIVPLFVVIMLAIALLGFVDTWFGFRSKTGR